MKTLIKIAKIIGVLLALIVIIGLCLPSKVKIERSMEMQGTVKLAFNQVNILKNWENWNPQNKSDTSIHIIYSGSPSGNGAKYTWNNRYNNDNRGILTITESFPDSLVKTEMIYEDENRQSSFLFRKKDDGIIVTWSMVRDLGWNPFDHYFGLMTNKMLGPDFEVGLYNLKQFIETADANGTNGNKENDVSH